MGRTRKQAKKESNEDSEPQPEAPKPEKTQAIDKKPKKYIQKSIEAIQRIERSKYEKIFLLNAERLQQSWRFMVQGVLIISKQTKGSQYHVNISTTVACTCFDFKMKKKPCKHIYFIVTQVAQNEQILDYFRSTVAKISKAAYGVLDSKLAERLKARMDAASKTGKEAKDIDLKDDTDCTICFTQMDKENQKLEDCSTCKKYFHVICIDAWKNHNPTCPLCRGALAPAAQDDPLGKLKGIKLT